jgi:hypothetical protein
MASCVFAFHSLRYNLQVVGHIFKTVVIGEAGRELRAGAFPSETGGGSRARKFFRALMRFLHLAGPVLNLTHPARSNPQESLFLALRHMLEKRGKMTYR